MAQVGERRPLRAIGVPPRTHAQLLGYAPGPASKLRKAEEGRRNEAWRVGSFCHTELKRAKSGRPRPPPSSLNGAAKRRPGPMRPRTAVARTPPAPAVCSASSRWESSIPRLQTERRPGQSHFCASLEARAPGCPPISTLASRREVPLSDCVMRHVCSVRASKSCACVLSVPGGTCKVARTRKDVN